jgi:hypothetical protein
MYFFHIAYRHHNGEVEGFTGTGFTKESARRHAEAKVRDKVVNGCLRPYDPNRLILSKVGLSPAEIATLIDDWKIDA